MIPHYLDHQTVDGAADGCNLLQHLGTAALTLESTLERLDLPAYTAYSGQKLGLLTCGVTHGRSRDTLGEYCICRSRRDTKFDSTAGHPTAAFSAAATPAVPPLREICGTRRARRGILWAQLGLDGCLQRANHMVLSIHSAGRKRLWLEFAVVIPLIAVLCLASESCLAARRDTDGVRRQLLEAVDSNLRPAADKARDKYRHPVETLMFFGIKPDMTVVELWPFGGWYTEILGPFLREHGRLYEAAMDPDSKDPEDVQLNSEFHALLAAHPQQFGKVQVTVLAPHKMQIAPDGTADMVLTFRNIHNWVWAGMQKDVFAAAYRALKPGGILGVVEHRNNDPYFEPKQSGQAYVGEQYAIHLIESVGFRLVARSNVNRNPKDTKDYPKGVWTLPPSYAEGDKDRAKYAAIGESDRFTLKFVKPRS